MLNYYLDDNINFIIFNKIDELFINIEDYYKFDTILEELRNLYRKYPKYFSIDAINRINSYKEFNICLRNEKPLQYSEDYKNDKKGNCDKVLVNSKRNEIIKPDFKYLTKKSNMRLHDLDKLRWDKSVKEWYIVIHENKYALFDENNRIIIDFWYDKILKCIYCFPSEMINGNTCDSKFSLVAIVEVGRKYGLVLIELVSNKIRFMRRSWKYIIEPIYNSVNLLNENIGILMVKINKKCGIINYIGDSILPITYDYIEKIGLFGDLSTNEEILKIGLNGKHGFAKSNGDIILKPEYDEIYNFERCGKSDKDFIAKLCLNGKYGYINLEMNQIVPIIFDKLNINKFKSNNIQFISGRIEGLYGVMDIEGRILVKPQFKEIKSLNIYDSWTKVKLFENNIDKYAYVDKEGNCKLICDFIENYRENQKYIIIKLDNKYGCILNNGEIILDIIYDEIKHIKYKNIFARVKINNQYRLIDTDKNHIIDIQKIENPNEDEQLEAIEYDINFVRYIKNPTEKVQLKVVTQAPDYIKYIENPSKWTQFEAVMRDATVMTFIKNPTENVQMIAIRKNPNFIQYLKKPSENVQLEAIRRDPYVIKYIKIPTEKVQLEAIRKKPSVIEYIKNPTEELQLISVSFEGSFIKYIKNPCKSVLEHSNVQEYYHNEEMRLNSDLKHDIPEYDWD